MNFRHYVITATLIICSMSYTNIFGMDQQMYFDTIIKKITKKSKNCPETIILSQEQMKEIVQTSETSEYFFKKLDAHCKKTMKSIAVAFNADSDQPKNFIIGMKNSGILQYVKIFDITILGNTLKQDDLILITDILKDNNVVISHLSLPYINDPIARIITDFLTENGIIQALEISGLDLTTSQGKKALIEAATLNSNIIDIMGVDDKELSQILQNNKQRFDHSQKSSSTKKLKK